MVLIIVPGAFAAYTKIIHRNGRNQNTKKKNDITCFAKGTEQKNNNGLVCLTHFQEKQTSFPERAKTNTK